MTDPITAAIQILEAEAASIRECHTHRTSRDDWTGEEHAKAAHDRMTRVAAELSKLRADGVPPINDLAHEIWAAAQTAPGHTVESAVARISALLSKLRAPVAMRDALCWTAGALQALKLDADKITLDGETRTIFEILDGADAALASAPADERADNIHALISRFRNATRDDAKNGGRDYFEAARTIESELRQAVDALASAPVAGEAQPSDVEIIATFTAAGINTDATPNRLYTVRGQSAQLVNGARALLARYPAPQASAEARWTGGIDLAANGIEMVRNAALEEAAAAVEGIERPRGTSAASRWVCDALQDAANAVRALAQKEQGHGQD